MSDLQFKGLDGNPVTVTEQTLGDFEAGFRGALIREGSPRYDEARAVWNGMIDRRPALIARCTGVADVRQAVRLAAAQGLLTSIRGGGHQIAGNAVNDGGLVIDLSAMNSVRVDPEARRVHVGPGATLGDVDHETQTFGLAVPTGINSTTGIAGLTLGGGFGWLSRRHGLTIDHLRAADVVTADGGFLRASEEENEDLFWALRGGGGNFGVVTRFEFDLQRVGPEVLAGLVVYPQEQGLDLLRQYRELTSTLAEESNVWVIFRQAPPLPFLPEAVHGRDVVVFALFHDGDPDEGQKMVVEPVLSFGEPLGSHVGVQPFTAWQAAFDPLLEPGARNYWKSHNFADLEDSTIEATIEAAGKMPSPHCEIFFGLLGGQISRIPSESTAYAHRDARFVMNVHGRWESAGEDEAGIGWSRDFFEATALQATGGVYINFMTGDEGDRVAAAYGASYERLAEVKAKYDPENLFRVNQNVRPKVAA